MTILLASIIEEIITCNFLMSLFIKPSQREMKEDKIQKNACNKIYIEV